MLVYTRCRIEATASASDGDTQGEQDKVISASSALVFIYIDPPVSTLNEAIDWLTCQVTQGDDWYTLSNEIRSNVTIEGTHFLRNYLSNIHHEPGRVTVDTSSTSQVILMINTDRVTHDKIIISKFTHSTMLHPFKCIQLLVMVICNSNNLPCLQSKTIALSLVRHLNNQDNVQSLNNLSNGCKLKQLFTDQTDNRRKESNKIYPRVSSNVIKVTNRMHWIKLKLNHLNTQSLKDHLNTYCSELIDKINSTSDYIKVFYSTITLLLTIILISKCFAYIYSGEELFSMKQILTSMAIGGLINSIVSNEPFVLLMPSPILTIWMNVLINFASHYNYSFNEIYIFTCCSTLFFLIIFSFINISRVYMYITSSIEQIFSLISIKLFSFTVLGGIYSQTNDTYLYGTLMILIVSMVIVTKLHESRSSNILNQITRDIIADNGLIITLIIVTYTVYLTGIQLSPEIAVTSTSSRNTYNNISESVNLTLVSSSSHQLTSVILPSFIHCILLIVFSLISSVLIIVENVVCNINVAKERSISMTMTTDTINYNRISENIFIICIINVFLVILKLPMINSGQLISIIHLRSLTKWTWMTSNHRGHLSAICLMETRLPSITVNLLLSFTLFTGKCFIDTMCTYVISDAYIYTILSYFSYLLLHGNTMYSRLALILCEKRFYPSNKLISSISIYKLHSFTIIQLIQFTLLALFTFSTNIYIQMLFPFCFISFIFIRHLLLNRLWSEHELMLLEQ